MLTTRLLLQQQALDAAGVIHLPSKITFPSKPIPVEVKKNKKRIPDSLVVPKPEFILQQT